MLDGTIFRRAGPHQIEDKVMAALAMSNGDAVSQRRLKQFYKQHGVYIHECQSCGKEG